MGERPFHRAVRTAILLLALSLLAIPALRFASAGQVTYHGNVNTKKFHQPGCRYYNCPNCVAVFQSRKEALAAGYVPCKVCNPQEAEGSTGPGRGDLTAGAVWIQQRHSSCGLDPLSTLVPSW